MEIIRSRWIARRLGADAYQAVVNVRTGWVWLYRQRAEHMPHVTLASSQRADWKPVTGAPAPEMVNHGVISMSRRQLTVTPHWPLLKDAQMIMPADEYQQLVDVIERNAPGGSTWSSEIVVGRVPQEVRRALETDLQTRAFPRWLEQVAGDGGPVERLTVQAAGLMAGDMAMIFAELRNPAYWLAMLRLARMSLGALRLLESPLEPHLLALEREARSFLRFMLGHDETLLVSITRVEQMRSRRRHPEPDGVTNVEEIRRRIVAEVAWTAGMDTLDDARPDGQIRQALHVDQRLDDGIYQVRPALWQPDDMNVQDHMGIVAARRWEAEQQAIRDGAATVHFDGMCPFVSCLQTGAHDHACCPACGAVRFSNSDCTTCRAHHAGEASRTQVVPGAPLAQLTGDPVVWWHRLSEQAVAPEMSESGEFWLCAVFEVPDHLGLLRAESTGAQIAPGEQLEIRTGIALAPPDEVAQPIEAFVRAAPRVFRNDLQVRARLAADTGEMRALVRNVGDQQALVAPGEVVLRLRLEPGCRLLERTN